MNKGFRPKVHIYVAAWYPYHYDTQTNFNPTEFRDGKAPTVGLGVDSMAMFYVYYAPTAAHHCTSPGGIVEISLNINDGYVDPYLLKPVDSPTWTLCSAKQDQKDAQHPKTCI